MFLPKTISRFFILSISSVAAFTLAGCGSGGGLADSATASRIVPVSNGEVDVSLSQVNGGSVSSSRVGLVAFATGVNQDRGQIVAVAGINLLLCTVVLVKAIHICVGILSFIIMSLMLLCTYIYISVFCIYVYCIAKKYMRKQSIVI